MILEITEQEKNILISCITMAAYEGFYKLDDNLPYEDQVTIIKEFMRKLRCSEEQIKELDY